ncbi:MAG: serine hydrolase domain-containing protein [Nocardioidaceae bacterium]
MTSSGKPTVDTAYWRARLREGIEKYKVPGATMGILRDGQIVDVAAGVLSKATLVEATPDSVFQIGSISKVWTTTLVMQLVDEGALGLDTPVVDVLPEFGTPDPEVTKSITVKHLLTHTSGLDGDLFTDTGRGDDCVEKFVAKLADAAQNHPVGTTFSYCNAAFNVAGRIVEVLTDKTWDAALRERIVEPLGLTATATLPEEAILHRAAIGHLGDPGTDPKPTTNWLLPRNAGPAGLITARVHDVLTFARMHIAGGVAPDGTRILSADSARAMTEQQVALPDPTVTDSWGLGWMRFDWDGHRVIGHDGGTIGQAAFLRLSPERDFAVSLLTNGGDASGLYDELYAEAFEELADITKPTPFAPPSEPVSIDLAPYVGHYSRSGVDLDVVEQDGGLVLRATLTGLLAELMPEEEPDETPLVPVGDAHFATKHEADASWSSVLFYELPDGTRYIHSGFRATPRVDS